MPWTTSRIVAAALLLAACQRVPLDEDPPPEDETGSTEGDDPTTTNASAEDSSQEPSFGCEPGDAGTCPSGQKCTALAQGGPQNDFQCVNDDGTIPEGEDCTPAPGTGQDGCAGGTVCLISSQDDALGSCIEACGSDADCEPGKCTISPYTLTPFCADSCDPLFPDCPFGRSCLQSDDRFMCGIAFAETDIGVLAEECDSINLRGCTEGFACMAGALIPGCNFNACCTNVCDMNGGDEQCTTPALCKTLFPMPAPGFDNLGACYVPT